MRRRGLTLSEVILALGVLSLALVVAVGILQTVMGQRRRLEQSTRAAFLAQEVTEELLAGQDTSSGSFPPPYQDYAWSLARPTPESPGLAPLEVTVTAPGGAAYTLRAFLHPPRQLVFTRQGQLWEAREDGRGEKCLGPGAQMSFSAEGKLSAFLREGRLLLGTPPAAGPDLPAGASELSLSPDARRLACSAPENGYSQVMVGDLRSRVFFNKSQAERHEGSPAWSPRGDRLAFVSSAEGESEIVVMDPQGTGRQVVSQSPGWNAAPYWSPDGSRLAFMSNRDGNPEIYSLELKSGQLTRLTDDPAYDTSPRYSPDGAKIAFVSDRDGVRRVWVMSADGSRPRPLHREPRGAESDPVWRP